MRFVVLALGLGFAGAATAAPPRPAHRKPAPPELSSGALEAFVDGVIADKAGDLETALRRFTSANQPDEHAHIFYNIAELYRRMEQLEKAIASYRKYLELAPKAPDRAAVQRLIAQLEQTPGTVVIDGDDLDAVVFVDGKLIGPSPVVIQLPDGKHTTDRIGPTSYGERKFVTKPLSRRHLAIHSSGDKLGNVVMNGSPELSTLRWKDRGHAFQLPGRFALPPGRHETFLARPGKACTPIAFEVPAGPDELVYVWIEATGPARPGGCIPITVRASRLRFPASEGKRGP